MSRRLTIALDAMGGDQGAETVVPAALAFLEHSRKVDLILVGRREIIAPMLDASKRATVQLDRLRIHHSSDRYGANHFDRLRLHHATEVVGMDEPPSKALRGKKDSSMRVAIDLVKSGQADACVSAGNTGALMATARFVLKTLPLVDRPAIIASMPSVAGVTHMLDLGANVDCSAAQLFQFAVMGSELVRAVLGIDRPKVGLLNIGEEEIKGNDQVRRAHELISASSLNYLGYVEGDDIYMGGVDVVVADGFVGNVALKSSEGVAKLMADMLGQQFRRNLFTRLAALAALPVLKAFKRQVDPRLYNGASLVGLRGIVVKSHGGADALAFEHAIEVAEKEIHANVIERIEHEVSAHLGQPLQRAMA
jgi:glycerol-3-phosphate acyltransferase PlsX